MRAPRIPTPPPVVLRWGTRLRIINPADGETLSEVAQADAEVVADVFLPALLTGNAVVYKPSELAPLTGLAIADLLHAAGVPDDAFRTVVGDGRTGAMLLEQPIDALCFTGSHATGVRVAAALA